MRWLSKLLPDTLVGAYYTGVAGGTVLGFCLACNVFWILS